MCAPHSWREIVTRAGCEHLNRSAHQTLRRDVIVVGASAGGIEALKSLLEGLQPDLPASVLVVQHTSPRADNALPELFARSCALPVNSPSGSSALQHGHVYVAVPDRHLLIEDSHVATVMGPKENRHRPAIDSLFRSAARRYGPRVIGVILTGLLDDGTAGMWEIKRHNGVTIVQDPQDAAFPDMPRSVLEHVEVDHCIPLQRISPLLDSLCRQDVFPTRKTISAEELVMKADDTHLSCPECGGPLQHLKYGPINGFRCRVRHKYSPQSVLSAHAEKEEAALWHAIVALEEGADLARELGGSIQPRVSKDLRKEATAKRSLAKSIRSTLDAIPKITAATESARAERQKAGHRRSSPRNSRRAKAAAA